MGTQVVRQDAFTRLDTSLTDDDAGGPRLLVSGELDIASAAAFGAHLSRLIAEHGPDLVIDVSALGFCDGQGVAAFFAADRLARRRGGALTLSGVTPQLAKLLRITGLDRWFARTPAATRPGGPACPGGFDGWGESGGTSAAGPPI